MTDDDAQPRERKEEPEQEQQKVKLQFLKVQVFLRHPRHSWTRTKYLYLIFMIKS